MAKVRKSFHKKEKALPLFIISHLQPLFIAMHEIITNTWWKKNDNALVIGATGTGKSYAVSALAHQACSIGMKTLYLNMNHFVPVMKQAYLDGTSEKLLGKLGKTDLLILDDFGMQMMTADIQPQSLFHLRLWLLLQ